jgi:hypothetical protein
VSLDVLQGALDASLANASPMAALLHSGNGTAGPAHDASKNPFRKVKYFGHGKWRASMLTDKQCSAK